MRPGHQLSSQRPLPPTGLHGGIDVRDARNGQLRLRLYLPEPFAMLNTDIDGLHGGFLTTDENGQRLFALTTSGLTVIQLTNVPLGVGTLSPAAGSAAGGVVFTLRGSGFGREISQCHLEGSEHTYLRHARHAAGLPTTHAHQSRWRDRLPRRRLPRSVTSTFSATSSHYSSSK